MLHSPHGTTNGYHVYVQVGRGQSGDAFGNTENPILYIETGDHFRRHIKDSGYTWDLARKVNETGGRQPDFLAVWIWSHLFIEEIRGGEHIVFDGMPRSLDEAKMLNTALPFYKRKNPTVIFLNVSEKWAEDRLRGRGRADDLKPEVVAKRLAFFNKDVVPQLIIIVKPLGIVSLK